MIEVEHLTKRYGDVTAVDDVSFKVEKGEIVGFLGRNGAGKTTTMRILTTFLPASGGTARVAGLDVFDDSLAVRRRIGYLPERPPLYLDMTVRAYLGFVADLSGLPSRERDGRVDAVEDMCGLAKVDGRLLGHLSKGYRQRAGLAQALIHNPDVLILDEPMSALDPQQWNEMRALVKSLAGTHTILFSTHFLPEITLTCKRAIIINQGRIVADAPIDDLTARLRSSERVHVATYAEPKDFPRLAALIPGVTAVLPEPDDGPAFVVESGLGRDVRRELGDLVFKHGWGLRELRPLKLSLEEAFLKLVSEVGPGEANPGAASPDDVPAAGTSRDGERS